MGGASPWRSPPASSSSHGSPLPAASPQVTGWREAPGEVGGASYTTWRSPSKMALSSATRASSSVCDAASAALTEASSADLEASSASSSADLVASSADLDASSASSSADLDLSSADLEASWASSSVMRAASSVEGDAPSDALGGQG